MSKTTVALDLEDLESRQRRFNLALYGESGSGKTTLAASAPRPILWLDAEGGTNSIGDRSGIKRAAVRGVETFRAAATHVRENPDAFETVVIDSGSESQALVSMELMRGLAAQNADIDLYNPRLKDFGTITGIMREVFRTFRDLEVNFIVTALTREDTDDMTGKTKVTPKLMPELGKDLVGFMDATAYLYVAAANNKKGEVDEETPDEEPPGRVLLLQGTSKYVAKVRAPEGIVVPPAIRNPTWDELVKVAGIAG